ncbi:MAG: glycosyltransferase family 39 protein [Chloroflexi bacterium]|nr:glycosyltransferase family 39 protein [Chloroflexota bacterium]
MAPRDLLDITIRSAADIHPPLYYYLLHFWSAFVGTSELALRWLSLVSGLLLVSVVYALGRRLFSPTVGLLAAVFAAVSPFLVYYSQEARMYSQVAFLAALSFYLFARLIPLVTGEERIVRPDPGARGGSRPWLPGVMVARAPEPAMSRSTLPAGTNRQGLLVACYVLVTAAMLYSHYFSFTILAAQNVAALALIVLTISRKEPFRRLAGWVVLQAVIVTSYVPWLILTARQLQSWPSISEGFSLGTLVRRVFLVFTFGLSSDAAATPNREAVFYALALAACLLSLICFRKKAFSVTLVIFYLALPVLILYFLSLKRPMYNPKFLLLAAPAYCLLLAAGLESIRKTGCAVVRAICTRVFPGPAPSLASDGGVALRVSPFERYLSGAWSLAIVALLLASVAYPLQKSLAAYYFDSTYARDNYRGLVGFVSSRLRPGDAIVLNAPGQEEIFRYYFKQSQPTYPPPIRASSLPRQRPMVESETAADLQAIGEKHSRTWLVLWATAESDPGSFVEHWLDQNSFKIENRWFGNIRLCLYANPGDAESNNQSVSLKYENGLRLDSLRFGTRLLEPGDSLDLMLGWEADRKIEDRYTVFVHIIDEKELLWGQMDSEPAGGSRPTDKWVEGTKVEDRRGVQVLAGTPPGEYMLEVGLYQPASGRRLAFVDDGGKPAGDRYLFGPIKVVSSKTREDPTTLGVRRPLSVVFRNRISLLGYNLHPLGRETEGAAFSSVDIAHLTLFWLGGPPIGFDSSVRIEIRGQDGRVLLGENHPISEGKYPTGRWREGDLIRDQYKLALGGLPAGEYGVYVSQLDADGNVIQIESSSVPATAGSTMIAEIRVK